MFKKIEAAIGLFIAIVGGVIGPILCLIFGPWYIKLAGLFVCVILWRDFWKIINSHLKEKPRKPFWPF
jgi:uncharacterized membrane protein YvlD (DUF360 family)